ncbi:hypothetical protein SOVF_179280 isoform A [Spinacia oleracea]|nr:protein WVD2-like 1 isoform X2 [Spinacia oleracea]KNA06621.1 hypothetical protein SOVF_179280 isoform A [Spinacia oleracea]
MGREVTGVRIEQNKSPFARVQPKVSADSDQEENPKSPEGNTELKDCEVKECTSEVPRAEKNCEKQEVLANKSANLDTEKLEMKSPIAVDQKLSSTDKATGAVAAGNFRMKNTPQKPTNVDKQVWESPKAVETPVSPSPSNSKSPSSSRKSQPTTPFLGRKPFDDEDNWSVASSARTTRSRTTVGVAPTFTCTERLEKRREYYAKLEEKRKALEAEKLEYEARTKEDEEAAVKQLRKNMMFRANPVPNFYYEKPPPKRELKKLPTTRAVSPKFGRRKSCSDAFSSPSEDKSNLRASRRSLGSQRESSTPISSSLKKKDPLVKSRLKQVKETTKITSKMTEKSNPDIAVLS